MEIETTTPALAREIDRLQQIIAEHQLEMVRLRQDIANHQVERIRLRERIAQLRVIGRDMRASQIRYFKTRSQSDLIEAKQLEKQFDEMMK